MLFSAWCDDAASVKRVLPTIMMIMITILIINNTSTTNTNDDNDNDDVNDTHPRSSAKPRRTTKEGQWVL